MTRQRDLGPVLALTGAGAAVAAAIAGFILVGGPGDTRDKRIDHKRLASVAKAISLLDCAYAVYPDAPDSLASAAEALSKNPEAAIRNHCAYLQEDGARGTTEVEYRKLNASNVELCQTFLRAEPSPPRVGDPDYADMIYMDGPFGHPALDIPRPNAGRFCYALNLADRAVTAGSLWDSPLEIDALAPDLAVRARADKRAIGDVVNMLRLLRCARDVGSGVPETFEAAVAAVDAAGEKAGELNCEWPSAYYANPENQPVATLARVEGSVATVCATFATDWPSPLQLDYYGAALAEWPTSLPELQAAVTAGAHCYEVNMAVAPQAG